MKVYRKYLVIGLIILIIGVNLIPSIIGINLDSNIVKSNDLIDTLNGNTLYVGGSGPGNYTKIQDAINDASKGDTVFVYDESSPYKENLRIIRKSEISLVGENRETTIIDGQDKRAAIQALEVNSLKINGFTIKNGTGSSIARGGIEIPTGQDYIIENNIIINNDNGIIAGGSGDIKGNIISNSTSNGLFIRSGNQLEIKNNIIRNNSIGICLFYYSKRNHISYNEISSNGNGIYIGLFSNLNHFSKNNFIKNTNGHCFEMPLCIFNKYRSNFWDDWIGHNNPLGRFFPYFRLFGVHMKFDWFPVKDPYDI